MQSTLNLANIEPGLLHILKRYPLILPIGDRIIQHGGKAYLIGGAVRDIIRGAPVHDLDIEVHDITLDTLADILSEFGTVSLVGKSFGVLKIHGTDFDWALPRTDRAGRKPEVLINPQLALEDALRRRDLTMNAMAIDLASHAFIDPFHGYEDMLHGRLRSPDKRFFQEDPLRFYRVMQFIGRFEMEPDDELQEVCMQMDISQVSIERIEDEFEKLLLKSRCPSLGLRWLQQVGRLPEILPELARTIGVKQDPDWHPEGDVYEHLMQTLDAAASIANKEKLSSLSRLTLCYAALCHDLGKVTTSIIEDGRIKSPGHAEAGVPYARALLKRITRKVKIIQTVVLLVKYHMQPSQFVQLRAKLPAYRRLALKIAKYTTLEMLSRLALADRRGRNEVSHEPLRIMPSFVRTFLQNAQRAEVLSQAEQPILHGRDISDLVRPGPEMGRLLKYAFELQLDEGIKDKERLKKMIREAFKEKQKK